MDTDPDATDPLDRLSDLVRRERSVLAAAARAEGVSPEDAIDCVQEALYTLIRAARRGSVPGEDAWGAVLTGTVRNAARNRRRRHFRSRPHDDLDAHALTAEGSPAADEIIAWAEERVRLRACVEELCEIQKAVVTLRMLEEQPGEDVAQALGISPGHVAVLLHRAKRALEACMTSTA
jgi:RNA polymerase sigma-70 factor (ECF subfamily)